MEVLESLITEGKTEEVITIVSEAISDGKNLYSTEMLSPHGENLLHWAAANNNGQLCRLLIGVAGMEVDMPNYRGTNPLYYAAMNDAKDAIRVLLDNQANPRNRSGFSGRYPNEVVSDPDARSLFDSALTIFPATEELPGLDKYKSYKYRTYMSWQSNMYWFHIHDHISYIGVDIIPEASAVFTQLGITGLAKKVKELRSVFLTYRGAAPHRSCLHCEKMGCTFRCSKCKATYYCSPECQRLAHNLHKYDCQ